MNRQRILELVEREGHGAHAEALAALIRPAVFISVEQAANIAHLLPNLIGGDRISSDSIRRDQIEPNGKTRKPTRCLVVPEGSTPGASTA